MKQRPLKLSQKRKINNRDIVNIELDTKCSCCTQSTSNNDESIQFTCRYLQCQSSMPIRILRLFIEKTLPYSPIIKISIFDSNDRLLKDSDRLYSLKHTYSSSNYIPIRFTLLNTITSLTHCSCLSSPIDDNLSSLPIIIQQETIEQILSTCSFPIQETSPMSPCLSSPSSPNSSIGFCNLLNPPSFFIDQILSKYGEICPSSPESEQYCVAKENLHECTLDIPLDLSMKKKFLIITNQS